MLVSEIRTATWQHDAVIPFLNSNKCPLQLANYRPISLLNSSKVFEKLQLIIINDHLTESNIFPQEPFGFRVHHDGIVQLFKLIVTLSTSIDKQFRCFLVPGYFQSLG